MANFNNNRNNNRGGGKPFAKKAWENRGGGGERGAGRASGPITLHKATCAECGKICEVPFRPISGKPVYCKDCFLNRGEGVGAERISKGGERFSKRDFSPSRLDSRDSHFKSNAGNDVVVRQLESINAKLELLVKAMEAYSLGGKFQPKNEEKKELKETVSSVVKKTLKKKPSRK